MMKFEIITLVDITETKARFDKNSPDWHRQQNFITVVSTLGLRVNPKVENSPTCNEVSLTGLGFGTKYKGKSLVWNLEFEIEQENAHSIKMMEDDFDLVPIILGLGETAKIKDSAFLTRSRSERNIIFNYTH